MSIDALICMKMRELFPQTASRLAKFALIKFVHESALEKLFATVLKSLRFCGAYIDHSGTNRRKVKL